MNFIAQAIIFDELMNFVNFIAKRARAKASEKTKTRKEKKQAGTGPSRRHIQGSKMAKGLPSVNLQYSKSQKNGPSGAPGPASASPWRAKEKKILDKKSLTMPKN